MYMNKNLYLYMNIYLSTPAKALSFVVTTHGSLLLLSDGRLPASPVRRRPPVFGCSVYFSAGTLSSPAFAFLCVCHSCPVPTTIPPELAPFQRPWQAPR